MARSLPCKLRFSYPFVGIPASSYIPHVSVSAVFVALARSVCWHRFSTPKHAYVAFGFASRSCTEEGWCLSSARHVVGTAIWMDGTTTHGLGWARLGWLSGPRGHTQLMDNDPN